MPLDNLMAIMLPAIEKELFSALSPARNSSSHDLYEMLTYHMGWEDGIDSVNKRGKRIRPLLVTLCNKAAGGDWQLSLPAAAAVELVHNFSLIHDDIEDNSESRRGRPTLWNKWGVPLAINAGDALFTLAHLSIFNLERTSTTATTLQAAKLLHEACLRLTSGQHMDIAFESLPTISIESYWKMIEGKTAALLAVSTELGAIVANVEPELKLAYRNFGRSLGLAFQAQDDLLGIWGDETLTGKSIENDLISRKKTLPILYGLSRKGVFAEIWNESPITSRDLDQISHQLEIEGAREYTQNICDQLTEEALAAFDAANPKGEVAEALKILAMRLLWRTY